MKRLLILLFILPLFIQAQNIHLNNNNGQILANNPSGKGIASKALIVHDPVQCATVTTLPTNTYANNSGFQSTITANSNGAFPTVDGITLGLNQRILVNNETDSTHNGLYNLTQIGDGSHPFILTRGDYASIVANMGAGSQVYVNSGAINGGLTYMQSDTVSAITIGTTKLWYLPMNLNPMHNLSDLTNKSVAASNLGLNPATAGVPTGINPNFLQTAYGIPRVTNSYHVPDTILYDLVTGGNHLNIFFDTAFGTSDGHFNIGYPLVRTVIYTHILPDEAYANTGVFMGCSVGLTSSSCPIVFPFPVGVRLSGNGTGTWTRTGIEAAQFTWYTQTGTQTGFDVPVSTGILNFDPDAAQIVYIGANNYHVKRNFSGLGSATVQFVLQDAGGNPVLTNPTSSDGVVITNCGLTTSTLSMFRFDSRNSFLASGFTNLWAYGEFEVYEKVQPISTTSLFISYQTNYPSATAYKIYRCSSRHQALTFPATGTLVFTGGAGVAGTYGVFTDTGLTTQTNYWYQLVATVGGVDTNISYFQCATK